MIKVRAFWFWFLFPFLGIGQSSDGHIGLPFEKDLFPEGIAIDTLTKQVYLNSLSLNKIVRCNLDGSQAEDFIDSNEHGYLSGFGMTIKGDTLYALGNVLPKTNNTSILLLMGLSSKQMIAKYTIANEQFIYLNDLAVDSKGTVYITDSESSDIYTINQNTNELEVFFSDEAINHSNGITISPDGKLLYLASYTSGLRILDIASKKLVNQPNDHKGIDGLKFHKNNLFAIVNARRDLAQNGIFQFGLNAKCTEVVSVKKLTDFENVTDIPTTFAIYNSTMHFVADSQLDNFDGDNGKVIHPEELEDYRLVQLKIP